MTSVYTEIANTVNSGLIVYPDVEWVRNATVAYGQVVSVSPASGSSVAPWSVVTITASLGTPLTASTATVPNVVGMQSYQAGQAVAAAGLIINVNTYASSSVVPQTYVISQSLTAGSVVAPGTVISLVISMGPATTTSNVTVP
jgi:serine/threonine-protein kinase